MLAGLALSRLHGARGRCICPEVVKGTADIDTLSGEFEGVGEVCAGQHWVMSVQASAVSLGMSALRWCSTWPSRSTSFAVNRIRMSSIFTSGSGKEERKSWWRLIPAPLTRPKKPHTQPMHSYISKVGGGIGTCRGTFVVDEGEILGVGIPPEIKVSREIVCQLCFHRAHHVCVGCR